MINKKKPEDVVDAITKAIFMDGAKLFPSTREKVTKIIHQELQKAREEEREQLNKILIAMSWQERNETPEAIRVIAEIRESLKRYHSELDRPNK